MTPYEKLVEAREFLSDKDNWIQGTPCIGWNAQDGTHRYKKCLIGALGYFSMVHASADPAVQYLMAACEKLFLTRDPTKVNDYWGYEAAMKVLDEAIAIAYAEEGVKHDSVDGSGQGIGHNRADNPVILVLAHRQMVVPQRSTASEWCETTGLNIGGGSRGL